MGKQKHDLGVRKRAINKVANSKRPPRQKPTPSFAIGPDFTDYQILHMYGPPSDVRDRIHALRQLGQPTEALRLLDQHTHATLGRRTALPMRREPGHFRKPGTRRPR